MWGYLATENLLKGEEWTLNHIAFPIEDKPRASLPRNLKFPLSMGTEKF